MTFSYYREPDTASLESQEAQRQSNLLKSNQKFALEDIRSAIQNEQTRGNVLKELGKFSSSLAEIGGQILSKHIEEQTAQAHFDYHTGANKNPGVLDSTIQSINNASKLANQVANDIEQEDGTGSIIAEEVRSRDPYYVAAYQRAQIQGIAADAPLALENAKETLTIIGEDGVPKAYNDITKPADMAAWQAAFTRQFIGDNFSNITTEAFASLVDEPLTKAVTAHSARWSRENAERQKKTRDELHELDVFNSVKKKQPQAIINTAMSQLRSNRMGRADVADTLKKAADSGDLSQNLIQVLSTLQFDHVGGGKTTLKDQLGEYWNDIEKAAAKRVDDLRQAEKAQRKANEEELLLFWRQQMKQQMDRKDLTAADVDKAVENLTENLVSPSAISEFQKLYVDLTLDAKQAEAEEKELEEKARNKTLTVRDVLESNINPNLRNQYLNQAREFERLRKVGMYSRERASQSIKESIRKVLGVKFSNESTLGAAGALEEALNLYEQFFMELSSIDPGDGAKAHKQAIDQVNKLILNGESVFTINDPLKDVQTRVDKYKEESKANSASSSRGNANRTTGPTYFTQFVPPSFATPSGSATGLNAGQEAQIADMKKKLAQYTADKNTLNTTNMIPELVLFDLIKQVKEGKEIVIPNQYYKIAEASDGELTPIEAFNQNAKVVDESFKGIETDFQRSLRTQGANDPQIQIALQGARGLVEEQRLQRALANGNSQPRYMSQNIQTYREGGAAHSALVDAIINQESGGDPSAYRADSGATGLSQILSTNIPSWTKKHLGYTMTPQQFNADPTAQRIVTNGEFRERLQQQSALGYTGEELIRRVAAGWYGGPGAVDQWDNANYKGFAPGHPNMKEYTKSVYKRFLERGGFGVTGIQSGTNQGIIITDPKDPGEGGIDFVVGNGKARTPFYFPFAAKVVKVVRGNDEQFHLEKGDQRRGPGNYVELNVRDPDSGHVFEMRCAHFGTVNGSLRVGQQLQPGAFIGTQGRSGSTTNYHVSCDAYGVGTKTPDSLGNRIFLRYLQEAN